MTKPKKQLKERTRNAGTMTESMFWSSIRSILRRRTIWWQPIKIAKQNSRRPNQGDNKRQKWEYQCSACKEWFSDKEVEVDHIIPAGSLTCAADLPGFVERLFCEVDGFTVLCKPCHHKKTHNK